MIRSLLAAFAATALCVSFSMPAQAADSKIGIADPRYIATQSDPGKEAEKILESRFGKERRQLEQQSNDVKKQAEDFQKQAPALSEKARAERAAKLQQTFQDIDNRGGAFAQRVSRVQQEINTQMNDVLRTACINYAQKNGFDVILDASVVMFRNPANDVTDGVIQEVNKVWKSKGGKFKITSK